jgi:hypothetical protein
LVIIRKQLTAGVTGKGGNWRQKPPDAESAVGAAFPESAAECPHLSGARGVGRTHGTQDSFIEKERQTQPNKNFTAIETLAPANKEHNLPNRRHSSYLLGFPISNGYANDC